MSDAPRIEHVFVDEIPDALDQGKLYISVHYATVLHLCFCGCGNEVVTPLAPTDWRLSFDGETVSLDPSVGNWALPCRSHYWVDRDRVYLSSNFSDEQVRRVRARDKALKASFYDDAEPVAAEPVEPVESPRWWLRAKQRIWRRT